ncbi:MAG TPA: alpha/beta fold hydrolase [Croceibacterium sp.]|nr:alpha/beta fold hydrolase [Croceibacterium sp.]
MTESAIPGFPPAARAPGQVRNAIARRVDLLRRKPPVETRGPSSRLLLGEPIAFLAPLFRRFRAPVILPRTAHPRVVMLLPGFGTHPLRMRYMAQQLERAGHKVKRWGLGFNLGPTPENFALLEERVRQIGDRYGQKVVLVGWSLGGIFAREIAKRRPELVAKVITMGTPFSGSPYANNAWRVYQLVTGHSVEQPPVEAQIAVKPPVETVALWSPRDGVIAPRSACGLPGERDRAVALRCSHIGFAGSDESIAAVARELERG